MVSTPEIYSQQQQILTVYPSPFSALVSPLQQETRVGITQPPILLLPNIHSRTMSSRPITFEQSSLLPLYSSSVGKVINFIPHEPITPQASPVLSMAQGNNLMTCSISPNDVANIQNIASSTNFFAKKESDTAGLIDLSTSNRMTVPGVECGSATEQKGKNKVKLPMIDDDRQQNVLNICERFEALEALKKRKHYHVYEGEDKLRLENNNDKNNNISKKFKTVKKKL
ncbi:hypothetical protein INT45_007498 [Circinella minor]|uniref:Uncharacterized protein n=1 Tax=Circinella minor TaxID=1195481 RepID=A0A8H7SG47_9FUNG|nr:hypothetical protein INT45_007498 [Circinella minor]